MGPRTACPDRIQLRLLFGERASTPEADVARAHVAQCEFCRAIVVELEVGDHHQNTMADEAVVPPRPVMPSSDATVAFRKPEIVARLGAEDHVQSTMTDEAVVPPRPVTLASDATIAFRKPETVAGLEAGYKNLNTLADQATDSARPVGPSSDTVEIVRGGNGEQTKPGSDATVMLAVGAAANGGFLGSPESLQIATREGEDNSAQTCCMLGGDDSSQIVPSDTATAVERRDDRHESVSSAARLEGVTVPGYDILEELGRGGMGVVYKARHRRLQRLVALKMVLAGAHVGQVGLARFRAEAEAVAKLLHSNIVQIYETGEHEGRPYFSLEFVDGGSLEQRIRESPTTPRAAAQLVETLARTMEVAHQRGIVHRDLKPANILLAKLGSQSSDGPEPGTRFVVSARGSLVQEHRAQDRGFWSGQAGGRRFQPDAERHDPRHAQLHGAGTGGREEPGDRPGRRHLFPRVRSSTSCWWVVRRSRRAIRSTPSVRSSSKSRFRRASWSRAFRMTWRRFA